MEYKSSTVVLCLAALVGAIVLVATLFQWPAAFELAMDDAYIYFTYARNLVDHGQLMFNAAGEPGVGATSPLWVFVLAAGYWSGIPLQYVAKAGGLVALALTAVSVYFLLAPVMRPALALTAAALVGLSGNMLWFALSGMETTWFVALGLLALLLYRSERWTSLALALGLLPLLRPEGILLWALIAVSELARRRKLTREVIGLGLLPLVVAGPWFGYLFLRSGYPLPTSGLGKMLTARIGIQLALGDSASLASWPLFTAVFYVVTWVGYLLEFGLGGMALPAPMIRLPVRGLAEDGSYAFSMWAVPAVALVIAPLVWSGLRPLLKMAEWRRLFSDPARRPLALLLGWFVLHNLFYGFLLPVPGTAGRYGALNFVVVWVALVVGLKNIGHTRWVKGLLVGGVTIIAACNTLYWNTVYDANVEHMERVRIAAARYVREALPQHRCAAFDIGALRFYSQRPVVDLGGLIDPELGQAFRDAALDEYLVKNHVDCLVLPTDGWFDLAAIAGLRDSPRFAMQPLARFTLPHERWLIGFLPTGHYQPSVTIYALRPP